MFEFAGRMVDRRIITDRVAISFELRKVAGRQLTWPEDVLQMSNRVDDDAWCQEKSIAIENICNVSAMVENRRGLAIDAALQIYSRFGWDDAPKRELESAQQERFGQPIHV